MVISTFDLKQRIMSSQQISQDRLWTLENSAHSQGNFAVKLIEELYPELFSQENLRLNFSYNRRSKLSKKELDPVTKAVVKCYVLYFYPELKRESVYQKQIIDSIIERLIRPLAPL